MLTIPPNFIEITPAYVGVADIPPVSSGLLTHHWVGTTPSGSGVEVPDVIGHVDGVLLNDASYDGDIPTVNWLTRNSISFSDSWINRMECSPVEVLNTGDAFTIAFWINQNAIQNLGTGLILSLHAGTGSPYEVLFSGDYPSPTQNKIVVGTQDGSIVAISHTGHLSDSVWHHVAITYDGSGLANQSSFGLFIDAVSGNLLTVPNTIFNNRLTVSPANRFGGRPEATGEYFTGKLDDIRIYNSGLSAAHIGVFFSGYNNIWTNNSGDNLWATDENWPLNGVPVSGGSALFASPYQDNCNTASTRIKLNDLCVSSSYTGILDIAGSFITIDDDVSISGGELQVGGTLQVGGHVAINPTTYTKVNIELLDIIGSSDSKNITVPSSIGRFSMNSPGKTGVLLSAFSCNSLEINGGHLDLNENNIVCSGDWTMRGGGTIDFDNTSGVIGGSCKLYGSSDSSRVALNPSSSWVMDFTATTGVSFLIRNAIIDNLTASGISAECLNCVAG